MSALGTSVSQDSFTGAFGGGMQWKLTSNLSVRTSADYLYASHDILGGARFLQNNIRVSTGLVFTLGDRNLRRARSRN